MNLPLRQMGGGAEGNAENGSVHIVCSQDPQDPCGCPRPASGEGGRGPTHREEGKNKGKLYTSTFTDTPMFHTGIHPYPHVSYWHTPILQWFILAYTHTPRFHTPILQYLASYIVHYDSRHAQFTMLLVTISGFMTMLLVLMHCTTYRDTRSAIVLHVSIHPFRYTTYRHVSIHPYYIPPCLHTATPPFPRYGSSCSQTSSS